MAVDRGSEVLRIVNPWFAVESAESPESLREVFRVRYQVYCVERRFEPGEGGIETDYFDATARHVLLRYRPTGQAIGTVRLILPGAGDTGGMLPMELLADLPRLRKLPRSRLAEISRFALSKELRAACNSSGCLARLALIRGIVDLSNSIGLTHWCALMEPKLLRLLTLSGIHFTPIAGLVEHHGLRQPSMSCIDEMLRQVRRDKPAVWDFITDAGTLWPNQSTAEAA